MITGRVTALNFALRSCLVQGLMFGKVVLLPRSKVKLAVNFETAIDNIVSAPGLDASGHSCILTSLFIAKSTTMSTQSGFLTLLARC